MHKATQHIATEASWRLKSLMRTRRFHSVYSLVRLYKAQVLSFMESSTAAIAHAAPTLLDAIDSVHRRFLRELGIDEIDALREFSLPPLSVRRDISMLGVIHRSARREGPPQFQRLFPLVSVDRNYWTRTLVRRHHLQVQERYVFNSTDVIKRSAFGLVPVYNALPSCVVGLRVRRFQSSLQRAILRRATAHPDSNWSAFLRLSLREMSVQMFQVWFT